MKNNVFLSLLTVFLSVTSYAETIQVVRNAELLNNTLNIRQYNNIKYVNIKSIADICRGQLSWYHISGKVTFSVNNQHIDFYYNSIKILMNTKKSVLPAPSLINKTGLYIPLEFIFSEKFTEFSDYKARFDESKNMYYFESVTNIASPRVYFEDGCIRINVELSEKLKYEFKKSKKDEYAIKFYGGKVVPEKINYQNALLKQIEIKRYYKQAKYIMTVGTGSPKVNVELQENPLQLAINISSLRKSPAVENEIAVVEVSSGEISVKPTKPVSELNKLVTIVVDAGHGGEDPGAIGVNGTKEKDLNLIIAKEVARLLSEDNFNVILTRDEDKFIPLVERTETANKNNADIFVSIHCNASINKPYMKGFEIYFLSEKATDKDAEAVAARENSVIKLETKRSKKQEKLEQLLWSMVRNEFINESSELCYLITKDVIDSSEMDNLGIRQAGFYVLRGTQMPAVLVECGFLTNLKEELRLKSSRFQKNIADSIYSGLKKYIQIKNLALKKANEK